MTGNSGPIQPRRAKPKPDIDLPQSIGPMLRKDRSHADEGVQPMSRTARRKLALAPIAIGLVAPAVLAAGCVQLQAPDKPIEINLNVNIKQEVVVTLRGEAQELIKKNQGVF
jgi:hypothetical protein